MKRITAAERLALLGTLAAVFDGLHPLFDQWGQAHRDAVCKGLHGGHEVYPDGTPVGSETDDRSGQPVLTASQRGRRAVARHVAVYSAGQLAGAVVVTRALGCRVPLRALLAGTVVNAATHAVIDRREPLLWLAEKAGKSGYIDQCTAVRMDGGGMLTVSASGPGTALMDLDQALHRGIGVAAAVITAWLAARGGQEPSCASPRRQEG